MTQNPSILFHRSLEDRKAAGNGAGSCTGLWDYPRGVGALRASRTSPEHQVQRSLPLSQLEHDGFISLLLNCPGISDCVHPDNGSSCIPITTPKLSWGLCVHPDNGSSCISNFPGISVFILTMHPAASPSLLPNSPGISDCAHPAGRGSLPTPLPGNLMRMKTC